MVSRISTRKFWIVAACAGVVAVVAGLCCFDTLEAQAPAGRPMGSTSPTLPPAGPTPPTGPTAPASPAPPAGPTAPAAPVPSAPMGPGAPMPALSGAPVATSAPVAGVTPSEPTFPLSVMLPGGTRTIKVKNWDGTATYLLRFKYKSRGEIFSVDLPASYKTQRLTKAGWDVAFRAYAMDTEHRLAQIEKNKTPDLSGLVQQFLGEIKGQVPSTAVPALAGVNTASPRAGSTIPQIGQQLPGLPPPLPGMP